MLRKIQVKITGMYCKACEETIKQTLKETPGIKETKIDYKTGLGTIIYEDQKISRVQIIKHPIFGDKSAFKITILSST